MRSRELRKALAGAAAFAVATATATALVACGSHSNKPAGSSVSSSATARPPAPTPAPARQQVTLPINGGQHFYPHDVAVDAKGTVYATAINEGVLKLPRGAQQAVSVGFT